MFRGQSWGRFQSDAGACFIPFSLSISMNRTVVACKHGCQALLDTGTSLLHGPRGLVREIQNLIHARPIGHEVKGHSTGSLPGSPHKDQQIQPLSLFLLQHLVSCQTIGTLPPVVFTINGIDYPVPAQAYVQVRGQPWGWFSNLGLAGTLTLLLGVGRPLQAQPHHCRCGCAPVAGPVPPRKPTT